MSISAAIILDIRRVKKNGRFPVKLRVISERVSRDYPTVFELTESDHKKLSASRISDGPQGVKKKLQEIITSSDLAIRRLDIFSFSTFEAEYIN